MTETLHVVQRSATDAFQSVGKTLLGKYQILDGLALGGMAEIYLARVVGSHEYVVIKQMQPRLAKDPEFVRMFLREARLAAQLEHDNIGRVYDIGEDNGLYFFAMEYLHGYDARALFARAFEKKAPIPLAHALTVVANAAAGLQYAHDKRDASGKPLHIVHRDVSPSNIFITYDGAVKLVDFGLARVAEGNAQRTNLVKGKSAYLSPEQCQGTTLDRRSDIFSLGTVLYELTTNTRLFRRSDADNKYAIMNRIIKGTVPLPSTSAANYPRTLEDVVLQALDVDPVKRHPTAKALLLDLEAVARTEGMSLSNAALAEYLTTMLGRKSNPWEGLDSSFDHEDSNADELHDDFDGSGPSPDEFDEEVATSLYTGNIDDIKDAWAAEALALGTRASSHSISRPSLSRIALPLQAEDSDVFENPLIEVDDDPGLSADSNAHGAAADTVRPGTETSSPGTPMPSELQHLASRNAITAPGRLQSVPPVYPDEPVSSLAPAPSVEVAGLAAPTGARWGLVLLILALAAGLITAAALLT